MAALGAALIGAGNISQSHARGYVEADDAELIGAYDILPERASEKAAKFGFETIYDSLEQLLDDKRVDAVSVCTPNRWHAPQALAALTAGKHVLVEKPMTTTAAEGEALCAAAESSGRIAMVAMCMRFSPDYALLKQRIGEGAFGEIYQVNITYVRRRGIPRMGGWFTTHAESGGGALIDCGVHYLDMALWLLEPAAPVSVTASVGSYFGSREPYVFTDMWGTRVEGGPFDVDDSAAAFIRMDSGAVIVLQTAWAGNRLQTQGTEVLGTEMGCRIAGGQLVFYGEDAAHEHLIDVSPQLGKRNVYTAEVAHFLARCRTGEPPIAPPADGLRAVRVIEAIYQSAEQRREVQLVAR